MIGENEHGKNCLACEKCVCVCHFNRISFSRYRCSRMYYATTIFTLNSSWELFVFFPSKIPEIFISNIYSFNWPNEIEINTYVTNKYVFEMVGNHHHSGIHLQYTHYLQLSSNIDHPMRNRFQAIELNKICKMKRKKKRKEIIFILLKS